MPLVSTMRKTVTDLGRLRCMEEQDINSKWENLGCLIGTEGILTRPRRTEGLEEVEKDITGQRDDWAMAWRLKRTLISQWTWPILSLWALKLILFWEKDQYGFLRVTWIKWRTDEKDLSCAFSSHSKWDVSLVGKMEWGWLFPWQTNNGEDDHCGGLLGHQCNQDTACILYVWAHLLRNQDNCPFYPLSCVTHWPHPTSSERVYLSLEGTQLLQHQKTCPSQSSPSFRAPIFLTRLCSISVWNTEAWFFYLCFRKRGTEIQPLLNVCHSSLGFFTLLLCCLEKKSENQERERTSSVPFRFVTWWWFCCLLATLFWCVCMFLCSSWANRFKEALPEKAALVRQVCCPLKNCGISALKFLRHLN